MRIGSLLANSADDENQTEQMHDLMLSFGSPAPKHIKEMIGLAL